LLLLRGDDGHEHDGVALAHDGAAVRLLGDLAALDGEGHAVHRQRCGLRVQLKSHVGVSFRWPAPRADRCPARNLPRDGPYEMPAEPRNGRTPAWLAGAVSWRGGFSS